MMTIFSAGNIITLCISIIIILIIRYVDKKNRYVDLAKEYGKRLKDEIASFADEKASEVKDNGLVLDIQRTAVKEALNRLNDANEELTKKADAIALRLDDVSKIGDRISAYDQSLEELIRMTAKVGNDIKGLRQESVFIDETIKKIKTTQNHANILEKNLEHLEERFEQENKAALEVAVANVMTDVESNVDDLKSAVKEAEQQVETHRNEIETIHAERKLQLEKDAAFINKTLEEAVEKAAARGNQFEEAAYAKLKEEALVRINNLQKTIEEKLKAFQETARGKVSEIGEMVKAVRNEWKTDREELEAKRRSLNEQFLLEQQQHGETWKTARAEIDSKLEDFHKMIGERLREYNEQLSSEQNEFREVWKKDHEELEAKRRTLNEQFIIEQQQHGETWKTARTEIDSKLEDFHEVLDAKLREYNEQLYAEQQRFRATWQSDQEALDAVALSQRKQWEAAVAEAENRLTRLGEETNAQLSRAEEDINLKIKRAEEDINTKIHSSEEDINSKIIRAEENLLREIEKRLEGYREEEVVQWKRLEAMTDDVRKLDGELRLIMEEAQVKARRDFTIFEEDQKQERDRMAVALLGSVEDIRGQMTALEEELAMLKTKAYDNVSENLKIFEDEFFADIAKRRSDVDRRLAEWQLNLEQKLAALGDESEAERRNLEVSFKEDLTNRLEEQSSRILSDIDRLKSKIENFQDKTQNGLDETESRVSRLSSSIEAVRNEINEYTTQTRLFERTDELRKELERNIDALRSELSGLEEKRAEAERLETEFIKIRRLEDEVNTKMTRFLTEKNHLEIMEKDFERLLQTSARVDERLKEVILADDTLQKTQVSIRKLEDAIVQAEDKYQRVEGKNQILEETISGIDRSFQMLSEADMAVRKCREKIDKAEEDLDTLRPSIELLAAASEKARDAESKLHLLDTGLTAIESRIEKMQTAREWLVRAEARFEELNKKAEAELSLIEGVMKSEVKKSGGAKGALPPSQRENVVKLKRMGWDPKVIAETLKISRGEVELILEMERKD